MQQVCLWSKTAAVEACQGQYLNIISPLKSINIIFFPVTLSLAIPTDTNKIHGHTGNIYRLPSFFLPTFALQKHYLFSTSIPDMFRVFTLYSINSRPRHAAVFNGVMDWV